MIPNEIHRKVIGGIVESESDGVEPSMIISNLLVDRVRNPRR